MDSFNINISKTILSLFNNHHQQRKVAPLFCRACGGSFLYGWAWLLSGVGAGGGGRGLLRLCFSHCLQSYSLDYLSFHNSIFLCQPPTRLLFFLWSMGKKSCELPAKTVCVRERVRVCVSYCITRSLSFQQRWRSTLQTFTQHTDFTGKPKSIKNKSRISIIWSSKTSFAILNSLSAIEIFAVGICARWSLAAWKQL